MSELSLRGRKLLLWFGLAALAACGDSSGKPSAETETHFLQVCEDSCGGGLSCICGVCTEACIEASTCEALSPTATCAATANGCESEVAMACAAGESGAGGVSGQGPGGTGGQGGAGGSDAYGVRLEADDTTLCPGECAILNAFVDSGIEPYRYAWSGLDEDGPQLEVCPDATTTYEVMVTDSQSTLEEFGDDQEASSSLEIVVGPDCGEDPPPVGNVMPACELRIPHSLPNTLSVHTGVESQTLMTTDSEGNALLVGSFQGTIAFGNGVTATSRGIADGFVLKLSPSCVPLWVKQFGSAEGNVGIAGIALDAEDEMFVVGSFGGTVDFGDGTVGSGGDSAMIMKLDASGELIWKRVATSTSYAAIAYDLGVTDGGDVVVAGYGGTELDLGGGPIGGDLALGSGVGWVARLSGDGEHRYSYGLHGAESHATIAVHGSGLVAISGCAFVPTEIAGESVTFDPEEGLFLAVLDDTGALLRSRALPLVEPPPGGRLSPRASGVSVVYGSDRSLYFDLGSLNVENAGEWLEDPQRIVKLDDSGNDVWAVERAFIGVEVDGHFGGLALDSAGNILQIDEISEDAYVDGQPIAGPGSHDVYIEKLDPRGELLWSRTLGADTLDRTWAQAIDVRDAIWITYAVGTQYETPDMVSVIMKLDPEAGAGTSTPGSTE